jgi:ketosteroid isomerase-like protein
LHSYLQFSWLLSALLVLACPEGPDRAASRSEPSPHDIIEAVTRLEQVEWARASKAKDTVWFQQHIAPEAVFTTGRTGAVTSKETELAEILAPTLGAGEDKVTDLVVRGYGNVAVATFRLDATGVDRAGPYQRAARYTETWNFRDGRWQLIASHSSLLPDSLRKSRLLQP